MSLSTTLNDIATGRGYWRYLRKMILPPATAGSGRTFGEGGGAKFLVGWSEIVEKTPIPTFGFLFEFRSLGNAKMSGSI